MSCSDPCLVTRSESATLPDDLTERQVRVPRLLRGSLTLSEIATELSLSPNTVKTHTQAIYRKLGVRTREDAVIRGLDRGILRPPVRHRWLRTRRRANRPVGAGSSACGSLTLADIGCMRENQAIYARLGYTEVERCAEDGYRRIYMEKRLPG